MESGCEGLHPIPGATLGPRTKLLTACGRGDSLEQHRKQMIRAEHGIWVMKTRIQTAVSPGRWSAGCVNGWERIRVCGENQRSHTVMGHGEAQSMPYVSSSPQDATSTAQPSFQNLRARETKDANSQSSDLRTQRSACSHKQGSRRNDSTSEMRERKPHVLCHSLLFCLGSQQIAWCPPTLRVIVLSQSTNSHCSLFQKHFHRHT